jgi:hypothetical protein
MSNSKKELIEITIKEIVKDKYTEFEIGTTEHPSSRKILEEV